MVFISNKKTTKLTGLVFTPLATASRAMNIHSVQVDIAGAPVARVLRICHFIHGVASYEAPSSSRDSIN